MNEKNYLLNPSVTIEKMNIPSFLQKNLPSLVFASKLFSAILQSVYAL